MARPKSSFPLRFNDELTLRVLRVVAKARHVSINTLIEEMVERELPREVELVESQLAGTLDALHAYKGKFKDDWAAFAKAEGEVDDPIQAAQVDTANDPLGVNAVFA
jgi:hypothetical protein